MKTSKTNNNDITLNFGGREQLST